jgi:site-specific recombinase XerD
LARELSSEEITKLIGTIEGRKHAKRDRAILMLALYSGLTIKEIVGLRIAQVISSDGQIAEHVLLSDDQTIVSRRKSFFVHKKAKKALKDYLCDRFKINDLAPLLLTDTTRILFTNQKSQEHGFTQNALASHFYQMMSDAEIPDASAFSLRKSFAHMITEKVLSRQFLEAMDSSDERYAIARHIELNLSTMKRVIALI